MLHVRLGSRSHHRARRWPGYGWRILALMDGGTRVLSMNPDVSHNLKPQDCRLHPFRSSKKLSSTHGPSRLNCLFCPACAPYMIHLALLPRGWSRRRTRRALSAAHCPAYPQRSALSHSHHYANGLLSKKHPSPPSSVYRPMGILFFRRGCRHLSTHNLNVSLALRSPFHSRVTALELQMIGVSLHSHGGNLGPHPDGNGH